MNIELAVLLGGASLAVRLAGAGRLSLDALLDLPQRFLQRVRGVIGTPQETGPLSQHA